MAFGRTINILCLLTYLLTSASSAAVERLYSASAKVLRRCRIQDNTLDMHIFLRSIHEEKILKMLEKLNNNNNNNNNNNKSSATA